MNQDRTRNRSLWASLCATGTLGVAVLVFMAANYSHRPGSGEEKNFRTEALPLHAGFTLAQPDAGMHPVLPPAGRTPVTLNPPGTTKPDGARVHRQSGPPEITVAKSGSAPAIDRRASKPSWKFLTRDVRRQIDSAVISPRRWKVMVLHSSATAGGGAAVLDYYHRHVKGLARGLAYHFVIGNGQGGGNGEVEVGARWTGQSAGEHLRGEAQNEVSIGICLIGNFEKSPPSRQQQEALDELVDYLQAKLGKIPVTTHHRVASGPTHCPGKHFPSALFVEP
ncbi:MAG: N-acetylmuramoyl-L-alanine amidase [Verrucomicrobiales bacterium]|nr:N-acetylmuramoyl-L-alanine amidase [Verrucomicrobiales bacterium]